MRRQFKYGVRGVGEVPIAPPLSAVTQAVTLPTSQRYFGLPVSLRRETASNRLHPGSG